MEDQTEEITVKQLGSQPEAKRKLTMYLLSKETIIYLLLNLLEQISLLIYSSEIKRQRKFFTNLLIGN